MLLHRLLNRSSLWLLRGSAREVLLGPHKPAAHLLIFRELLVGTPDHRLWIDGVSQDQYSAGFGVSALLQSDNHAVAYFVLLSQRRFQVLGIDVHPFARDDDVLFTPLEVEITFGIEIAQVASAKPTFLAQHWLQFFSLPIAGRDVGAAHQDFSVLVELDLAAFEHLADRAFAGAKWMVQGNQRCRLRQAVALNDHEAQAPPEFLGVGVKRCTSGDEGPELPSELVVNFAEAPPAPHEV